MLSSIPSIFRFSPKNKYVLYISAELIYDDTTTGKLKIDMENSKFAVVKNPKKDIMEGLKMNPIEKGEKGKQEIEIEDIIFQEEEKKDIQDKKVKWVLYGYASLIDDDRSGKLQIDMSTAKFAVVKKPENDILQGLQVNKVGVGQPFQITSDLAQKPISQESNVAQKPISQESNVAQEPVSQEINYKKTTNIDDYKKITWYNNSCYFSTAMWFLWTMIPFREFISKYSGSNKNTVINDGFLAIKELFNEFNDPIKPEPVNIESIYKRVFDAFVKRNVYGNEVQFGDQETAAHVIETVLDQTQDDELLNSIRFIEKTTTKCSNNTKEESRREDKLITYPTITIENIFDEKNEEMDIERCRLGLQEPNGMKITKLDLFKDTNEYFILQFQQEQKYSDIKEIEYKGNIFKAKSIVSYLGDISKGGHWISYVFGENGKPFILDDIGNKRDSYDDDLDEIKINSLVLYKLAKNENVGQGDKNQYIKSIDMRNPRTINVDPFKGGNTNARKNKTRKSRHVKK